MTSAALDSQGKPYHHGNLKETLVQSAVHILEKEGLDKLSLRATARVSGVSQAAPYSHFRGKADLLACVAETGFQKMALQMADDVSGVKNTKNRIELLILSYLKFSQDNKALFHLMFGTDIGDMSQYPTLAMTAGKGYALFSSAVNMHFTQNDITGMDQKTTTASIWAMTHGFAHLIVDKKISPSHIGAANLKGLVKNVMKVLVQGIG